MTYFASNKTNYHFFPLRIWGFDGCHISYDFYLLIKFYVLLFIFMWRPIGFLFYYVSLEKENSLALVTFFFFFWERERERALVDFSKSERPISLLNFNVDYALFKTHKISLLLEMKFVFFFIESDNLSTRYLVTILLGKTSPSLANYTTL